MILQVEKLHKQFGGVHAVAGLDLQVAANQIHAIIGPNGAGKTTLLQQLCGALPPDSGRIYFCGHDITRLSQHQRVRGGLVRSFQITSIILPVTLLENVMLAVQSTAGHSFRFWSSLARNADLRARAMDCLAQVQLERCDRIASTLSHGEQRRLELAMALALRPKLLLLDEPTAGMGKEETAQMIALLGTVKGDMTIVLIEHDMDAVFQLADTTSVLVDGRIIATGSIAAIRNNAEVQRAYLGGSGGGCGGGGGSGHDAGQMT